MTLKESTPFLGPEGHIFLTPEGQEDGEEESIEMDLLAGERVDDPISFLPHPRANFVRCFKGGSLKQG